MGIWEHSKKAGRIVALIIVLVISGTLSVIMAWNDPTSVGELINKWLIVLGTITAFYFGQKQAETP